MRRTVIILVVVAEALAAGGGVWSFWPKVDKAPQFRTALTRRGDLVATISATGTLEPDAAVDVGAQVAGVIVSFGKDKRGKEMNWGSEVEAGTVLAKIDDSLYVASTRRGSSTFSGASGGTSNPRARTSRLPSKT
jgi:HlyD family secretion protein